MASSIGARGASALKALAIEAVNERFRSHRRRPAELIADPDYLDDVLARGNTRANEVAGKTLDQVRHALGMTYRSSR